MTGERSHDYTPGLHGHITHTELASNAPEATREWCAAVFPWTFQPVFASPAGYYHLFAYSDQGGGGIRKTAGGEPSGLHTDGARRRHGRDLQRGADRRCGVGGGAA